MKSEDEQMIQRIMDTDTMGYASVYDSGSGKREEYLVALTAENLASLIGRKGGETRQITVTDVLDRLVADSRKGTLDNCPDAQFLLEHLDSFRDPDLVLAATRLMHHLSRIFQEDHRKASGGAGMGYIDRRRRRKLQEKRMAQGHKKDDHEPRQTM